MTACAKARYPTKAAAEQAMRKLPARLGDVHRAYRHAECEAWHVTSALSVMAKRRSGRGRG